MVSLWVITSRTTLVSEGPCRLQSLALAPLRPSPLSLASLPLMVCSNFPPRRFLLEKRTLMHSLFEAMIGAASSSVIAYIALFHHGYSSSPVATALLLLYVLVWSITISVSRVYLGTSPDRLILLLSWSIHLTSRSSLDPRCRCGMDPWITLCAGHHRPLHRHASFF